MKRTRLSRAIRWGLASQMFAASLLSMPYALSQQPTGHGASRPDMTNVVPNLRYPVTAVPGQTFIQANAQAATAQPAFSGGAVRPHYVDSSGQPYYLTESGQRYYVTESGQPYFVTESGQPNYAIESGQPNYVTESGQPNYVTESGQPNYVTESGQPNYAVPSQRGAAAVQVADTPQMANMVTSGSYPPVQIRSAPVPAGQAMAYPGAQPQIVYRYIQPMPQSVNAGVPQPYVYYAPPHQTAAKASQQTTPQPAASLQTHASGVVQPLQMPQVPVSHHYPYSGQSVPRQPIAVGAPQAPARAPMVVYPQRPQQFVYVESSQPGLYRRVPVQAPMPQPVYVQAPAVTHRAPIHSSALVAGQSGAAAPAPRPSDSLPQHGAGTPANDLNAALLPTAPTGPAKSVSDGVSTNHGSDDQPSTKTPRQQSAKEIERSRLPILTNPMLTQRGAIQARNIAIEQAKKKAVERRAAVARASTSALVNAGHGIQQTQQAARAVTSSAANLALNQSAALAQQAVRAAGSASMGPLNQAPQVAGQSANLQGQSGYQPIMRPPAQAYYPAPPGVVHAAPPRQVLMQMANGQWVIQTLQAPLNAGVNPILGQMPGVAPSPLMQGATQVPPITRPLIQSGGPTGITSAVAPGQAVYPMQPPATGAPVPGVPSFPRPPITQLTPPPAATLPANVLTPAERAASIVANVLGSQLIAEPRPRVQQRRLTGSLTKTDDQASSQPWRSVESIMIDRTGSSNVETSLNVLSNVTPSSGASSNESQGLATVDLRGLGPANTHVLLNGRPFVPADGNGVANIDSIPLPLIERIDTVTGGTSVAYGSGGLAGAVNFVTNDRFQGTQVDLSHQTAFDGEGGSSSAALTVGTSFANGRGNIAASLGASERAGVFRGDREFSAIPQFDDTNSQGDPILINGGSSGVPGTSIFSGALGDFSPQTFGLTFNEDGSVRPFAGVGANDTGDFYNFAETNYLRIPQRRQQAMVVANFELARNHELYGTALATQNDTATQFAPLPVFLSGTEFTLGQSPFLPAATQQILSDAFGNGIDSDGDGIDDTASAFIRRRLVEVGDRRSEFETSTQFFEGGLRGRLGRLDYDLYASKGQVEESVSRAGNINNERFRQGLVLDLDAGLDGVACRDVSSNGGSGPCVPVNIFGPGNISSAAVDWLRIDMDESSTSSQSTYGATLSAGVNLPLATEARIAVGAERRDTEFERAISTSEPLPEGQGGLFNLRNPVEGSSTIDSLFAEVYLPFLFDVPAIRRLDVEAGYRLSEHSSAGQFASYRAAASWMPFQGLTLRASYSNANRAPSIQDQFAAQIESFSSAVDPCSAAAGTISPETAAQCAALGVPEQLIGSPFLNLPGGQLRALSGGNPQLQETSALSQTLGVTYDTAIGNDMRLIFAADYFQIDSDSAPGAPTLSADATLDRCFDGSFASTSQLNPFCNYVQRRSDGSLDVVNLFEQNGSRFSTQGVDLNASFSAAVRTGVFSLDYNGTRLDSTSFVAFDGADRLDCEGRFGEQCGEPRPAYRHSVAARYRMDEASAGVIWRHIGRSRDDDDSQDFAVENIPAVNYIDLEFSVPVSDFADLSVGINNVANTLPPVIGDNQDLANTFPQTYDALGRTVFLRFTGASGLARK